MSTAWAIHGFPDPDSYVRPSSSLAYILYLWWQAYGEYQYKRIDEEERSEIVRNACPGPGACGGMYTANTMATAAEAMGMALPVRLQRDRERGASVWVAVLALLLQP